jgi:hypothetical protein
MTKTERFIETILKYSESKDYIQASKEWELHHCEYIPEETGVCICGKKHLSKMVVIQNKYNSNTLLVGYTCYRSTLKGMNCDTEFKRLMYEYKLSRYNVYKIPTYEQIFYNYNYNIINEWELGFLMNIKNYSNYSDKQLTVMGRIFKKFVFKEDLPDEIKSVSYKIDPEEDYDILFSNDDIPFFGGSPEKSIKEYITRVFDINKLKIRERLEEEEAYKKELEANKPKFTFRLNH